MAKQGGGVRYGNFKIFPVGFSKGENVARNSTDSQDIKVLEFVMDPLRVELLKSFGDLVRRAILGCESGNGQRHCC